MARFYFHIRTPDGLQRDDIGLDLDGPSVARDEAVAGLRDLVAEEALAGHDLSDWTLEVEDERGANLVTLTCKEVLRHPPHQAGTISDPELSGRRR